LIFPDNSASKSVCGEPLCAAATAEWEILSEDTIPGGLPFFGDVFASGFRAFDFDIRIQHFRLITGSN
jgi:hypothetical protein